MKQKRKLRMICSFFNQLILIVRFLGCYGYVYYFKAKFIQYVMKYNNTLWGVQTSNLRLTAPVPFGSIYWVIVTSPKKKPPRVITTSLLIASWLPLPRELIKLFHNSVASWFQSTLGTRGPMILNSTETGNRLRKDSCTQSNFSQVLALY